MRADRLILHCSDCLDVLKRMDDDSVDLVVTSPPYEDVRTYGIAYDRTGEEWVDWAKERYLECVRVCRGLVAWVVEGKTRSFRYSMTPFLLAADLHRAGVRFRHPCIYKRNGIPGSGGPDWFRNDWELILCSSKGKLPFSDNTACGEPPKFAPGGRASHRRPDGTRVYYNTERDADGNLVVNNWTQPDIANPGNVIDCGAVGGGNMGDTICHENEAPFPEDIPERFIRSCCPPDGVVLDPFIGSGTTAKVALRFGRRCIGIDLRPSQLDLTRRRCSEVQEELFT